MVLTTALVHTRGYCFANRNVLGQGQANGPFAQKLDGGAVVRMSEPTPGLAEGVETTIAPSELGP